MDLKKFLLVMRESIVQFELDENLKDYLALMMLFVVSQLRHGHVDEILSAIIAYRLQNPKELTFFYW